MNVIKDLLETNDRTNHELAKQLCLGIVRNALCELADDNFGQVQMDQANYFMASFMLELSTVTIYSRHSTQYVTNVRGKIMILDPIQLMKDIDYDEEKIKERVEEYLINAEEVIGTSRIFG